MDNFPGINAHSMDNRLTPITPQPDQFLSHIFADAKEQIPFLEEISIDVDTILLNVGCNIITVEHGDDLASKSAQVPEKKRFVPNMTEVALNNIVWPLP